MDRFVDPKSTRDQSPLAALKVILHSMQVTNDVSKNYHVVSSFLDKVLDAYLLVYVRTEKINQTADMTSDKCKEPPFVVSLSVPNTCEIMQQRN